MISVEIEKHPRDGLQDLIPHADVIFFSKTWAVVRTPPPLSIGINAVNCVLNLKHREMAMRTLNRVSKLKQRSPQMRRSRLACSYVNVGRFKLSISRIASSSSVRGELRVLRL
jgi:hypothetical protein